MFKDPWIPKELSFKPVCIDQMNIDLKVSNFITISSEWDIRKLREVVLSSDVEIINRIPINLNLDRKLIWHFDKTGKYTVKSGYKVFFEI